MAKQETLIEPQLLQPHPSGIGSFTPHTVRVQWTPSPTSTVPIRSTWKDAKGKPLTSRRISQLMLEGHYGPIARANQLKKNSFKRTKGIIFRCDCGSSKDVRFLRFAYLPKPGNYCPVCLAQYRNEKDKELELKARVRKAAQGVMEDYV